MLAVPFLARYLEIIPLPLLSPIHLSIDERLMLCLGCQFFFFFFLPPVGPRSQFKTGSKDLLNTQQEPGSESEGGDSGPQAWQAFIEGLNIKLQGV